MKPSRMLRADVNASERRVHFYHETQGVRVETVATLRPDGSVRFIYSLDPEGHKVELHPFVRAQMVELARLEWRRFRRRLENDDPALLVLLDREAAQYDSDESIDEWRRWNEEEGDAR